MSFEYCLVIYQSRDGILYTLTAGIPIEHPILPNKKPTAYFRLESPNQLIHCFFQEDMDQASVEMMSKIILDENGFDT